MEQRNGTYLCQVKDLPTKCFHLCQMAFLKWSFTLFQVALSLVPLPLKCYFTQAHILVPHSTPLKRFLPQSLPSHSPFPSSSCTPSPLTCPRLFGMTGVVRTNSSDRHTLRLHPHVSWPDFINPLVLLLLYYTLVALLHQWVHITEVCVCVFTCVSG